MRISFSTAALYPRTTLDSLALLQRCGYLEAELMPQCYEECRPSFARKIMQLGIKVSSIHFPLVFFSVLYNPYPGMIKETKIIANELAESAKIIGSDILVVHALPKKNSLQMDLSENPILGNLKYLGDILANVGTKMAVENNPNTLADTPEGLLNFLLTLAHNNIGPMVDTTESWEAKIDPLNFIKQVNPIHLHLSDHTINQKHLPAGKGDGDWQSIFQILKEIRFSGICVHEPAYRFYLEEPEKKLIDGRDFLESLMKS